MCLGRRIETITSGKRIRLPQSIDDSRLSDVVGECSSQPKELPSLLESYIQTIKLYEVLGKVLHQYKSEILPSSKGSYGKRPQATYNIQNILDLDTLIMDWRESLPKYLYYSPNTLEDSCRDEITSEGLTIPHRDLLMQAKRLYLR
jgi:hypothetical protein